jgi:hypothetical protein
VEDGDLSAGVQQNKVLVIIVDDVRFSQSNFIFKGRRKILREAFSQRHLL